MKILSFIRGWRWQRSSLPDATTATLPDLDHAQGYMLSNQVLPHITKFLAGITAEAKTPTVQVDDETVAAIEAIVDKAMTDYKLPGVAIGIVKDGEVVYAEGFGVGNVEDGKPVTPASLFNMASVSKMFTSAAIMQLVEQGLIDLDAPVTDYLPYFRLDDPRYTEITVRHLLGHTSGLPFFDIETDVPWKAKNYENPDNEEGALERHVRAMSDVRLIADPGGDETLYSTVAFNILGDIVAKVSGQSYEAYMQENILEPLGMDHSSFLLDDVDPDLLTTGYRREEGSSEATPWAFFPFNRQHSPGAGLIANVDDMNKWALAILNGGELNGARIVETETLDEIWTPLSTLGLGGIVPGLRHGLVPGRCWWTPLRLAPWREYRFCVESYPGAGR